MDLDNMTKAEKQDELDRLVAKSKVNIENIVAADQLKELERITKIFKDKNDIQKH